MCNSITKPHQFPYDLKVHIQVYKLSLPLWKNEGIYILDTIKSIDIFGECPKYQYFWILSKISIFLDTVQISICSKYHYRHPVELWQYKFLS